MWWGVPVRVPFKTRAGRTLVITAVLSPEALSRVLAQQRMPADYVTSIFDSRSLRVARSTPAPGAIGGPPTPSLVALMKERPVEGSGTTRSLEGVEVHTAFVRLPDSRWSVAVGVPFSAVASSATLAFTWYGGAILASLLLSLAVAREVSHSIQRPMRRLTQAAQAVGRGEVPEVGDPDAWDVVEVHEVAVSLRSAAEARQDSERMLREADQRKDAFIATLSHELRNPLSPIRQAAHVLAAPQATSAQRQSSKAIIDRQVHRMALLLEDLLDVARVTRGTLALRKEIGPVASILDEAIELATQAIETRQHELVVDRANAPSLIDADPLRLAQLVANLLINAAKYTPMGGHLHLRARAQDGDLLVEVSDDGQGLAPEHLELVFQMFTQLPAAPGSMVSGLGIGLSLSRALAGLHGGTLVAESEGLGRGSRFTLRVPLGVTAEAGSVQDEPSPAAPPPARPRRVLVADDNEDAADSIAALLALEGYDVRVTYDGQAALAAVRSFQPDMAILDIGMPMMDGHAVARAIRDDAEIVQPLLVAVTGWGQDQDVRRSTAAGFDRHLTKPLAIETLLQLMASSAQLR
jgi:signal transduction histidine kinase